MPLLVHLHSTDKEPIKTLLVDGVITLVGGPRVVGDADRTFTMRAIARSTTTAGKMEAGSLSPCTVYMWVVELERRERRTWTFPGNGYRIWE
jgi:hypothetical protein